MVIWDAFLYALNKIIFKEYIIDNHCCLLYFLTYELLKVLQIMLAEEISLAALGVRLFVSAPTQNPLDL